MPIEHWDYLRTVCAVARNGSYRKAGDELGLTNTTVSRHIEKLEAELGAQLFEQSDGRWEPTEAGQKLSSLTEGFQAQLTFFAKSFENQSEFTGALSISTVSFIESFFLSQHTKTWADSNPAGALNIGSTNRNVLIEMGQADVALRLGRPDKVGLHRLKLANVPLAIFSPTETTDNRWIGLPSDLDALPEMKFARDRFGTGPSFRYDSFPAIAKASLATGFPCVLPTCIAPNFKGLSQDKGGAGAPQIVRELWLVFHEKQKDHLGVRSAIDWLQHVFPSPQKCLCGLCDEKVGASQQS